MRPRVVYGSVRIASLSFLAELKNFYSLSRVSKSIAVRNFQLCVEGTAESLLLIQLRQDLMARDCNSLKILRTHGDVVSFLL